MDRITKENLEALVALINRTAGNNVEHWNETGSNVGTYIIEWAYGGCRLAQVTSERNTTRDITRIGTKRETYDRARAFLAGIEAVKYPLPTDNG